MRKVIVSQFLTLDGVSQAPGGRDEDQEAGFAHGGWQVPYMSPEDSDVMDPIFNNMGAMLLGRRTYDIFADYWPHAGDGEQELIGEEDSSIAKVMNSVPIYVASCGDSLKDWDHEGVKVTQVGKDLVTEINSLKQEDGKDIIIWGSADFAQTLMAEKLIDEFYLMIHPIVLGTGKKFFKDGLPKQDLELVSSRTLSSGVILAVYKLKQ